VGLIVNSGGVKKLFIRYIMFATELKIKMAGGEECAIRDRN